MTTAEKNTLWFSQNELHVRTATKALQDIGYLPTDLDLTHVDNLYSGPFNTIGGLMVYNFIRGSANGSREYKLPYEIKAIEIPCAYHPVFLNIASDDFVFALEEEAIFRHQHSLSFYHVRFDNNTNTFIEIGTYPMDETILTRFQRTGQLDALRLSDFRENNG
jgi:hypothetical protein